MQRNADVKWLVVGGHIGAIRLDVAQPHRGRTLAGDGQGPSVEVDDDKATCGEDGRQDEGEVAAAAAKVGGAVASRTAARLGEISARLPSSRGQESVELVLQRADAVLGSRQLSAQEKAATALPIVSFRCAWVQR